MGHNSYKKTSHKKETGFIGEQIASDFLSSHGYSIIARNWRCRWGEIDIIASIATTLVFIEVKTRNTHTDTSLNNSECHGYFGSAEEQIDYHKLRTLRRSTQTYLLKNRAIHNRTYQYRFDVITVYLRTGAGRTDPTHDPEVRHYKNLPLGV